MAVLRPFEPDDARAFLEVHHAAVREMAAGHYPAAVIEAWAPPIEPAHLERVGFARAGEIKLVALVEGSIAGIGEVVPSLGEVRACYVAPSRGGQGIGRAIMRELERMALAHGASALWLDSSLNARGFYEALDYAVVAHGEHVLGSGLRMACVRMRKDIGGG